jgi:hypothetical protein
MPSRLIFGTSSKPIETNSADRTFDQTAAVIAAIQTYLPLELTMIVVVVMCLCKAMIYVIYQHVCKLRGHTMTITIGNKWHQLELPLVKIAQHVNKDLVVDITSASSSMSVRRGRSNWLFIRGTMYLDNISMTHEDLNLRYELPTDFSVNAWTGRKLLSILEHDYYMLIRVITNDNTEAFHVVARMLNSKQVDRTELKRQTESTLIIGDRDGKKTRIYPNLDENIEMTDIRK